MVMDAACAPPALQLILSGPSLAVIVLSGLMLAQRWSRLRRIARQIKRRARRAHRRSIWHCSDEAIGGLQRAESFAPVLVSPAPAALRSSSHRPGAKLGSFASVLHGPAILVLIEG